MAEFLTSIHILSVVTFLPLAGAFIMLFFPREWKNFHMKFATFVGFLGFLISIPLWFAYDAGNGGFQFIEDMQWIPTIGARYIFGIDGISLLLLLLTTFIGSISILSSWTAIKDRVKEYYIFMLILQTGMIGVFVSLDFFLFYIFWEVMLVPMYFLIGIWGGPRKLYAAIKFFLYTLLGSVIMLLGILALYFYNGAITGSYTFDIRIFHQLGSLTDWFTLQAWVFVAFFVGFAIKVPLFPFHTWLPDAHVEAPTAGSVILAGVLLKMGTYGFVRFSLPIMPEAARFFMPYLMTICIIGVIYGAMVAMVQKDWKKLVAYSSVSHLGFTMVGVFAMTWHGISGGVIQMINHGLSTGALFLIVGLIYERTHTRMISDFGGLFKVIPVFGAYFMIVMLSSIGLPGLNGFIGEFTILIGVFQMPQKYWAILAATGIILGAAYMLWLYQRTMFGKLDKPENEKLVDLNFREVMTLLPIVVVCFWIGIYPKPIFKILDKPVDKLVQQVEMRYDYSKEKGYAQTQHEKISADALSADEPSKMSTSGKEDKR